MLLQLLLPDAEPSVHRGTMQTDDPTIRHSACSVKMHALRLMCPTHKYRIGNHSPNHAAQTCTHTVHNAMPPIRNIPISRVLVHSFHCSLLPPHQPLADIWQTSFPLRTLVPSCRFHAARAGCAAASLWPLSCLHLQVDGTHDCLHILA
jgi:hypothetical protein